MMQTTNLLKWSRLPLFFFGLALFFIGERYLASEAYHLTLRLAGCAVVILGFLTTVILYFQGSGDEKRSWMNALFWQLSVILGLGFYLLYRHLMIDVVEPNTLATKALLALWLTLVVVGLFSGAGCEWALRDSGTGINAEPWRVRRSTASWFGIGLLLVGLFGLNFAANKKDKVADWSYLKVTKPSASTLALVKTLTADMDIALFYPRGNEVLLAVSEYFNALAAAEPHIKVAVYDRDINPTQAEAFRISRNGQVVLDLDGKKARLETDLDLSKARKMLRDLDGNFQKNFFEVTANKKTIYFTRGHGEYSWIGDKSDEPMTSLRVLEAFLKQQNYSLRFFGIAEGSATAVPDDAAAVVVVGPVSPFQSEEIAVLNTYLNKGGNLMLFLDVEKPDAQALGGATEQPLYGLLAEAGIKFNAEIMANDRNYVTATKSDADRWFLFTNVYTSHDSVVTLASNQERIATLSYQGGYFNVTPEHDGWKAFETVRSLPDSFIDLNRNFAFDKDKEKRDTYVIGAVAEKRISVAKEVTKQSRIFAFADATAITDGLVRYPGNAVFFADGLKWLVGSSELLGGPASEEDVKIRHTRKEDAIIFNATVVLVPLMVILVGFFATRRKKRVGRA